MPDLSTARSNVLEAINSYFELQAQSRSNTGGQSAFGTQQEDVSDWPLKFYFTRDKSLSQLWYVLFISHIFYAICHASYVLCYISYSYMLNGGNMIEFLLLTN